MVWEGVRWLIVGGGCVTVRSEPTRTLKRMTNACENITFPRITYVIGKYKVTSNEN